MKLAAALAAAVLTLGIAACGDSDDDSSGDDAGKLRIGLEAPLSGDLQTLGEGMLNGAPMRILGSSIATQLLSVPARSTRTSAGSETPRPSNGRPWEG